MEKPLSLPPTFTNPPDSFPEERTSLSCDGACTVIYNAKLSIIKKIAFLLKIPQLMEEHISPLPSNLSPAFMVMVPVLYISPSASFTVPQVARNVIWKAQTQAHVTQYSRPSLNRTNRPLECMHLTELARSKFHHTEWLTQWLASSGNSPLKLRSLLSAKVRARHR